MPVYVKGYRRGKSAVRSYVRAQSLAAKINSKPVVTFSGNETPWSRRRRYSQGKAYFKAIAISERADKVLKAKYAAGNILLGRSRNSQNFHRLKALIERPFTRLGPRRVRK